MRGFWTSKRIPCGFEMISGAYLAEIWSKKCIPCVVLGFPHAYLAGFR